MMGPWQTRIYKQAVEYRNANTSIGEVFRAKMADNDRPYWLRAITVLPMNIVN